MVLLPELSIGITYRTLVRDKPYYTKVLPSVNKKVIQHEV